MQLKEFAKEEGVPSEEGWYIFKVVKTGDCVVRQLRDDGYLYMENGGKCDRVSNWKEYYSWFVRVGLS